MAFRALFQAARQAFRKDGLLSKKSLEKGLDGIEASLQAKIVEMKKKTEEAKLAREQDRIREIEQIMFDQIAAEVRPLLKAQEDMTKQTEELMKQAYEEHRKVIAKEGEEYQRQQVANLMGRLESKWGRLEPVDRGELYKELQGIQRLYKKGVRLQSDAYTSGGHVGRDKEYEWKALFAQIRKENKRLLEFAVRWVPHARRGPDGKLVGAVPENHPRNALEVESKMQAMFGPQVLSFLQSPVDTLAQQAKSMHEGSGLTPIGGHPVLDEEGIAVQPNRQPHSAKATTGSADRGVIKQQRVRRQTVRNPVQARHSEHLNNPNIPRAVSREEKRALEERRRRRRHRRVRELQENKQRILAQKQASTDDTKE